MKHLVLVLVANPNGLKELRLFWEEDQNCLNKEITEEEFKSRGEKMMVLDLSISGDRLPPECFSASQVLRHYGRFDINLFLCYYEKSEILK